MTTNNAGTVYIETSVVSYLTARPMRESMTATWQAATIDWWNNHRDRFQLFTSELTLDEAREGDREASARRLNVLESIPLLPLTDAVEQLTTALVDSRAVPASSRIDAAHIAVSAVHGIDYLLTWNFRHLANMDTHPLILATCERQGYTCPVIGSPRGLMGDNDDGR